MGESPACLRRSFSHPSNSSRAATEGDPLRALGESISFGRFLSESLAWEKWSAFSQNRYLEEIEKFSKPGSVAQKKAYFEAHYKRIAAKKAATLLEQDNTVPDDSPEPKITYDNHKNFSMDSELVKSESCASIVETPQEETPNTAVVDMNECNLNELGTAKAEVTESISKEKDTTGSPLQVESSQGKECNLNIERDQVEGVESIVREHIVTDIPIQLGLSNQLENIDHIQIVAAQEEIMPKDVANQENSVLTSMKKQTVSSSKMTSYTGAPRPPSSAKLITSAQARKGEDATLNRKKSGRDWMDRERLAPKSLHMSINISSHARETHKTSSPILQKIGNSRIIRTFVKTSKNSSTPQQTPTRESVNGILNHPSVFSQAENRRPKTLLDPSISGSRIMDGKSHFQSKSHFNSSTACGSKARSPIGSSFSFRTEERVAKRKEKLEENLNAKDAKILIPQGKSKEKADNDFKKMRQTIASKAKTMANNPPEADSQSKQFKKITITKPQSPTLGRKRIPSMVQATSNEYSRPPWRPSAGTEGSKHVIEKANRTPPLPKKPAMKKKSHENTSPNIQPSDAEREFSV